MKDMSYNLKNSKAEVEKVLQKPVSTSKVLNIILDEAHGEETPGKRSPDSKFREYKWSRLIVSMLLPRLVSLGYTVMRSNTTTREIGLSVRKRAADNWDKKHKVLLSIHNNAAGMGDKWMNATGFSFYTTRGQTVSDIFAEFLYTSFESTFPDEKFRTNYGDNDRDIEENFTVLMGASYWAVLAECLFQDNKSDVEKLDDPIFQQKIVGAFIDAIEMFNTWVLTSYMK